MSNLDFFLPVGTRPKSIALTINDLNRALAFYRDVMGFRVISQSGGQAILGTEKEEIVLLQENRSSSIPSRRSTGLYHFAVLVPSRLELACSIQRCLDAGWPIQGAADHRVSEAIYLSDPEGNGIEIYRDYPRSQWPVFGKSLQMTTEPLNVSGVMAELENMNGSLPSQVSPLTVLGHVHLKVGDIPTADDFYVNLLGFQLMQHFGSSAGFVSAGGYHHHIGYNTWESAGGPRPPQGASGLQYFSLLVSDEGARLQLVERLRQAGHKVEERADGRYLQDPFGNGILLV